MAARDYDDDTGLTEAADTDLAGGVDDGGPVTLEEQRYGGGAYVSEIDGDLDAPDLEALVGERVGLADPDDGQNLDGPNLGDDYAGDYEQDLDTSRDDALGISM